MQARDAPGNNKTDRADRFQLRFNLTGGGVCNSVDMSPLGSGLYSGSFTFTGTGLGVASVAIVLLDPEVRKHCTAFRRIGCSE